MINEYFRPQTIEQATSFFAQKMEEGYHPSYYNGGTEIITLGRLDQLNVDVAIDIKSLPSCRVHLLDEDYLVLGSALSLTDLAEANYFPLLTDISKEVADKTARNKITLGGNICGNIFYREAVLPFLLTNSIFVLADKEEIRTNYLMDLFQETLPLKEGELFVQAFVEKKFLTEPYVAIKVRQQWKTGYPLITAAAMKTNHEIRVAFSGLCSFPFRSIQMENMLNDTSLSISERSRAATKYIPGDILNDVEGSSEYRLFIFTNLLEKILIQLEGN